MSQLTKFQKVRNHLKIFGSITSWECIEKYKYTRLSDAIYKIRKELLADPNSTQEIISIRKTNGSEQWVQYELKDK